MELMQVNADKNNRDEDREKADDDDERSVSLSEVSNIRQKKKKLEEEKMIFGYRRSTVMLLDRGAEIRQKLAAAHLQRSNMSIREKPKKIKAVNLKTEMKNISRLYTRKYTKNPLKQLYGIFKVHG